MHDARGPWLVPVKPHSDTGGKEEDAASSDKISHFLSEHGHVILDVALGVIPFFVFFPGAAVGIVVGATLICYAGHRKVENATQNETAQEPYTGYAGSTLPPTSSRDCTSRKLP